MVACFPTRRQGAAAVVWRDVLLVIGGSSAGGPSGLTLYDTVTATDANASSWRTLLSLGSANALTHHAAAVLGDELYVLGGYASAGPQASVLSVALNATQYAADSAATAVRMPAISRRAPLPSGPLTNLGVATFDGQLFVAGGYSYAETPAAPTAAAHSYDPARDLWSPMPALPSARGGLGLAAAYGALWAIGGFGTKNLAPIDSVDSYVPSTGRWEGRPPLPAARASLAAVTATGGEVMVLGGSNATADTCLQPTPVMQAEVLVLRNASPPTTALMRSEAGWAGADWEWTSPTRLPTGRGFVAAGVLGGTLLAVGGVERQGPSSCLDSQAVDRLDLASLVWSSC